VTTTEVIVELATKSDGDGSVVTVPETPANTLALTSAAAVTEPMLPAARTCPPLIAPPTESARRSWAEPAVSRTAPRVIPADVETSDRASREVPGEIPAGAE